MKKGSLYKVEFYRFRHSLSIIKYMFIVPLVLFFISYINIAYLGNGITGEYVWASMASDFPYLLALVCTISAIYVGREFRQKTINYEIMMGYSAGKIALSKIFTCAVIFPVIILICMIVYLGIFHAVFCDDLLLRLLGFFFLFFHLCSCTVLYVLICRTSVTGGSLAFVRFFVVEAAVQLLVSGHEATWMERLNAFNQWYALVDVKTPLDTEWVISILGIAAVEYFILQAVLFCRSKWSDM